MDLVDSISIGIVAGWPAGRLVEGGGSRLLGDSNSGALDLAVTPLFGRMASVTAGVVVLRLLVRVATKRPA